MQWGKREKKNKEKRNTSLHAASYHSDAAHIRNVQTLKEILLLQMEP